MIRPVKIVLLANTKSGRGVAERAAAEFAPALRPTGTLWRSWRWACRTSGWGRALAGAGLLLLAGGDGTVHKAVGDAITADVPIYHIPCGNENLLAREFGMERRLDALRDAIRRWRLIRVDVGMAQDRGRTPVPLC
jgi:diacylglycerol kinase (ATP)